MLKQTQRHFPHALAASLLLAALSGCATNPTPTAARAEVKPVAAAAAPAVQQTDYYFVIHHENGRIYPIADTANYF